MSNSARNPRVATVYHGTAANYLDSFLAYGPRLMVQRHLERPAFCTSVDRAEAERFAIRHTPWNDLSAAGVVLEFDASAVAPKHFRHVRDTATMWNEREVAFFNVRALRLVAVWRMNSRGAYVRTPVDGGGRKVA